MNFLFCISIAINNVSDPVVDFKYNYRVGVGVILVNVSLSMIKIRVNTM